MGTLHGHVLAENRHMINLARELGMEVTPNGEAGVFHLRMQLKDG